MLAAGAESQRLIPNAGSAAPLPRLLVMDGSARPRDRVSRHAGRQARKRVSRQAGSLSSHPAGSASSRRASVSIARITLVRSAIACASLRRLSAARHFPEHARCRRRRLRRQAGHAGWGESTPGATKSARAASDRCSGEPEGSCMGRLSRSGAWERPRDPSRPQRAGRDLLGRRGAFGVPPRSGAGSVRVGVCPPPRGHGPSRAQCMSPE